MKKVKAFVTIEYSLLLPGISAVLTMLVCMGLYLHNQCILQTNIYLMSIEGARLYEDNHEQRLILLQKKEHELYHEKYILAENMEITYQIEENKMVISGSGKMANPFFIFGIGEESWKFSAESRLSTFRPAKTLRTMKAAMKLLNHVAGKENVKDES